MLCFLSSSSGAELSWRFSGALSSDCRCHMHMYVLCAVGHIKRTDGFLGLYRGLTPRLFSAILSTVVTNAVNTVSQTRHLCVSVTGTSLMLFGDIEGVSLGILGH